MNWNDLLAAGRCRASYRAGGDGRSEFEKDYHRIIGSASFRRLQDKTQVFPLDKSDFIRTRLTHSLEVSSFAKSLGQSVCRQIMERGLDPLINEQTAANICDILLCAGLIHDLGNPPFGHFGETAIREWFQRNLPTLQFKGKPLKDWLTDGMREDFLHFEGNAQALRLVSRLHYMVDEHGMNLTYALLNAIIKYPVSSTGIDKKSGNIKTKKMGYFTAEQALYFEITAATGAIDARHPLAFLLEAADDIAYRTADIEDGLKKGMFSIQTVLEELKAHAPSATLSDGDKTAYNELVEDLERRYKGALSHSVRQPQQYALQNWLVRVQGRLIYCAVRGFVQNYTAIMAGDYPHDLFHGSFGEDLCQVLGDVAFRYIFQSKPILKLEIAADAILTFLLDRFGRAALYYETDHPMTEVDRRLMDIVSDNYKNAYAVGSLNKSEGERLYLRLLLVTDFICGMTDSYAKSLYQELRGIY